MTTITLNGDPQTTGATHLLDLLAEHHITPETQGIAVALNNAIAPKALWETTPITNGDTVEIVKPFAGG